MMLILGAATAYSVFAVAVPDDSSATPVHVVSAQDQKFKMSRTNYEVQKTADPIKIDPPDQSVQPSNPKDNSQTTSSSSAESQDESKSEPAQKQGLIRRTTSKLINILGF